MNSGLASNETFSVVQDPEGFMWIGTNNGLQRFDGLRFETFRTRKNDKTSIPGNIVLQLLFDKKKNLWVRTADGKVGIFDIHKFVYHEMPVKIEGKDSLQLHDKRLIMDESGNIIFLFVGAGFVTWDEANQEFSSSKNFIPVKREWTIYDICQQPGTQKYWLGTLTGTIIYDRQTGQYSYSGHNAAKENFIEKFGSVPIPSFFMFDNKDRIWFYSWSQGTPLIYAYDLKNNEPVLDKYNLGAFTKNYFEIGGFLLQKNGTIWVRGLGIFARYLEKEKEFQMVYNGYENEQSISYATVNNLFEDREANIWVVTNTNGLYHFNPSAQFFTNVRQTNRSTGKPGDGGVMSFMQSRQGNFLVGTWGDGFYLFDKNFKMLPVNIPGIKGSPFAWCMFLSADSNKIWMGAQPGVYEIDQHSNTAVFHNPAIMKSKTVRQIVEDKFGNLWIGTQSIGLFKWIKAKGTKNFDDGIVQYPGIPSSQIVKITTDQNGFVWVGTTFYGVFVIDPANDQLVLHFGSNEKDPDRKISWDGTGSILKYDDSTMVIAGNEIYLFNTIRNKMVQVINIPESIPGWIASMEKDQDGYIWISTSNGILRLNPQSKIVIQFDRTDGIGNDLFVVAASYVAPDGRMFFGADNQFVVFDPKQVHINEAAPDITITGFKLMNKSLQTDSLLKLNRVQLKPQNNSIAISFSGLRYNGTYSISYKLEGLDKNWIRSDKANEAIYSHLPPGNYTLLLQAEDAEGHPSKNITKLAIIVNPPFWRTWWFLGISFILIILFFYWLDKQRTQKIRATESIRTRIATSLTEELSHSLSSINISSELAKTKADTDTERTKEYIDQISETSNRMVQAMGDMVWSIDPKNDTMQDTIGRMKDFAAESERRFNIAIVFDIEKAVPELDLDMARRYELLSIFKEAVTNAVKHSSAKYVQVSLRLRNSKFFMLIEDDGKGFDVDTASLGRGLNDMRRRASVIQASLYIESKINTGTIVKLEMLV
jgi:ligand-binding sensor domain-containing protein/two-component sensor histidine kinase